MHLKRHSQPSDKIFYYQGNKECDFVIQQEDTIKALIQVTWDMSEPETRRREIEGLLEAATATGCNNLTIITVDEETDLMADGKEIKVVCAWKWLLL